MNEDAVEYIYTLTDPRTDEVRYVGKTNNPRNRYQQHITQPSNNKDKDAWVAELIHAQLQPTMNIIEEIASYQEGRDKEQRPWYRERYWIKYYLNQGANLFNVTPKEPQQYPIVFRLQNSNKTPLPSEIQQLIQENEDLRKEVKQLRAIIRNAAKALNLEQA